MSFSKEVDKPFTFVFLISLCYSLKKCDTCNLKWIQNIKKRTFPLIQSRTSACRLLLRYLLRPSLHIFSSFLIVILWIIPTYHYIDGIPQFLRNYWQYIKINYASYVIQKVWIYLPPRMARKEKNPNLGTMLRIIVKKEIPEGNVTQIRT